MNNRTLADFRQELKKTVEDFESLDTLASATVRDYARLRLKILSLTDIIDQLLKQEVAQ